VSEISRLGLEMGVFSQQSEKSNQMEKSNQPIDRRGWDTSFFNAARLILISFLTSSVLVNAQPANRANNGATIIIPDGVTNIGFAEFSGHHNLTNITIPKTVLSIGEVAFSHCINLAAINVDPLNPNFSSVDGILFNKDKTTLIECPGGKGGDYTIPDSVRTIQSDAFTENTRLTSVSIPNNVTRIEWHAFMSCILLTNVTIGSGVTTIGDDDTSWLPFNGCSKLMMITVNSLNRSFSSVDGVLFDKGGTTLIKYPEGKIGDYSVPKTVTKIGSHSFSGSTHLTSVTIPDGVNSIEEYAFENCSSLTNIIIGKDVKSIGTAAFVSCTGLTSVEVPHSVSSIGNSAFYSCTSLTNARVSGKTHIGKAAFPPTTHLATIIGNKNKDLPNDSHATAIPISLALIKEPANNAVINAMWVDVRGTFRAKSLKQITVGNAAAGGMEMSATISGNMFEARNVFLGQGTNIIMAIAEDLDGNTSTNSVVIMGPTDTNTAQTFPVQIQTSTSGGFVPLPVTFTVQAHVPGKIQKVIYDFDGDNIPDQTSADLQPITHTYKTSGEYFPIITIQTTVGQFSSLSGMFAMLAAAYGNSNAIAVVNVQMLPVLMSTMKIADPVDIKWTATSNLYVLSGSDSTITEFDANGKTIRSLSGIGSNPSGLDVDDNGNVYVALTASNQVLKFKPIANSFEGDIGFSNGVTMGNKDGSTDKRGHYVADAENNRVQVFTTADHDGALRLSLSGELGLNHPKAVAAVDDFLEEKFYIADTGNNRVILVKLPSDNPEAVWKHMIARLKAGDVLGAMSDFSIASKDKYQEAYQSLSKDDLLSTIKDMENIKPATIESDHAQYYFESVVDGHTLTFPIEFDREFGQWKIMEY
jgi:hypothetical protein